MCQKAARPTRRKHTDPNAIRPCCNELPAGCCWAICPKRLSKCAVLVLTKASEGISWRDLRTCKQSASSSGCLLDLAGEHDHESISLIIVRHSGCFCQGLFTSSDEVMKIVAGSKLQLQASGLLLLMVCELGFEPHEGQCLASVHPPGVGRGGGGGLFSSPDPDACCPRQHPILQLASN